MRQAEVFIQAAEASAYTRPTAARKAQTKIRPKMAGITPMGALA